MACRIDVSWMVKCAAARVGSLSLDVDRGISQSPFGERQPVKRVLREAGSVIWTYCEVNVAWSPALQNFPMDNNGVVRAGKM